MVHGRDFVTTGGRDRCMWFKDKLSASFQIKTKVVGKGPGEAKEESVLNRVVRRTEDGWEYEADQRHADILIQAMHMDQAGPVTTAGEDQKEWGVEEEKEELSGGDCTEFRALAARANYLASDRADIQYALQEPCRGMAKPTRGHKRMLKRLARYLVGKRRLL